MELAGKVVVVTGAGSGIGRALALRFVAEGARAVVGVDRDEAGLQAVAAQGVLPRVVDVASPTEVAALVDEVEQTVGPIDVFFSNAGVGGGGGLEVAPADWERVLAVNTLAHVWAAQALVPRMLERGGGYLLSTASAAGLLTQVGSAPYSVSKHGAVAFAEWLSITYGDQGLTVSCLCPQGVDTPMLSSGGDAPGAEVVRAQGVIQPEQVAEVVVQAIRDERFLILPHPEVATYESRRAGDRDRWIRGMRRVQAAFTAGR
ncbi:MAG: short-chain dehydrogenase [Frankiales bacterium]|jgi:NAD(P)-dependent dehydrogenase (short-subunit alcohol dehydrogenase family)|nr:short-chain dehydrogenase [Frankiales bacterium]